MQTRTWRPRQVSRVRAVLTVVAAGVVVALVSARGVAGLYTDYLWFDSLGFTSVWTGLVWVKVGLVVVFTASFFALVWGNLLIANRLPPSVRPAGPEEDALAGVYEVLDRRPAAVRAAVALLLAVVFGIGAGGQWNEWILFRNQVPFGVDDAQFGRDVGSYVFQLPFLTFLTDWLFVTVVVAAVVTAAAHYLNDGIRAQCRSCPTPAAPRCWPPSTTSSPSSPHPWPLSASRSSPSRSTPTGSAPSQARFPAPAHPGTPPSPRPGSPWPPPASPSDSRPRAASGPTLRARCSPSTSSSSSWVDDDRDVIVWAAVNGTDTVAATQAVAPGQDPTGPAGRLDLPHHAVIVRPNQGPPAPVFKGLRHPVDSDAAMVGGRR